MRYHEILGREKMNMIQIEGATITKTTSGIFTGIVEGDWFKAAKIAAKVQKVAGKKPVKIYKIMNDVYGFEL
jgi:hypothetical protein